MKCNQDATAKFKVTEASTASLSFARPHRSLRGDLLATTHWAGLRGFLSLSEWLHGYLLILLLKHILLFNKKHDDSLRKTKC